ncbi:hypothetical protein DdX_13314 [Ditylenchus destructor]|uniref:Uncharacterized protein n=1 Tax=Ditylenchus destructor TaxID=166010 RepID=A0AAD4QWK8_9BILA|nr:hypothetical protein DdX_13314 [Ditylenchus destructor]
MTPSDTGDDSKNAESSGIPLEERRVVTSGRGGTPQSDSVMPSTSQNPSHGYQNPSQTHQSRSTPASSSTASDSTTPGVGVGSNLASGAGSAHRYSSPAPIISYTSGPGPGGTNPGGGANHHSPSGNPNMATKRSLPTNITFATGLPATLTDRFVQQHHPGSHGHHQNRGKQTHIQNKPGGDSKVSHKRLKKYASETSFASAVDLPSTVMCSHSDETPSPPIAYSPSAGVLQPLLGHEKQSQDPERGDREVRTGSNRVFHVRTVPNSNSVVNYFNPTPKSSGGTQVTQVTNGSGGSGGNAVINKLQRRSQCRADSDDGNGSGSVGSETTVASGTMTPQSRRNMRFKMRRPKSTGNMIPGTTTNHVSSGAGGHGHGVPLSQGHLHQLQSNNNNNSNSGNYDPSFTSATIHSLDDSIQKDVQEVVMEERRPSNFYLFEDDSNHEFDDEVTALDRLVSQNCPNGKFGLRALKSPEGAETPTKDYLSRAHNYKLSC